MLIPSFVKPSDSKKKKKKKKKKKTKKLLTLLSLKRAALYNLNQRRNPEIDSKLMNPILDVNTTLLSRYEARNAHHVKYVIG
jgi:hypothetical protein